ncbi:Flp pilus assembly protein TadG [Rhodovulum sp. P5]|uniref:TadE/TadG family type IV pilus assembly protein n=1 Tax=Rhodovulum sp. P5 TaxID=1564506 RepID=UPI0009C21D2F|nr:TadE/TadG family type IV pilus assembly protein [Rhodovulum sp. P5]ARE40783.1 Flp pilus assembly protein TadG [Rhodovulum sp. P5]
MRGFPGHLRRFGREEAGSSTVEVVILLPILLSILLMAVELGILDVRHVMLSRATDLAVREIRIGAGATPDFETFRSRICDFAMAIPNCEEVIRVEMRSLPPSQWATMTRDAMCIDRAEDIDPADNFTHGGENELMFIRVCALFDPVFPTAMLGHALPKNADGEYGLVVTSAFVNEPDDAT